MARQFDDTAPEEYLEIDTAAGGVPPFTVAGWFNSDDITIDQTLVWIGYKLEASEWHSLEASGGRAGDPVRAYSSSAVAGSQSAQSTAGFGANAWHHACGVWAATNDRRAYIDGGNRGNDANNVVPDAPDRTSVGRRGDATPTRYFSGAIAEAAIWSAALTDAEVAVLGRGYCPLFVRPQSLVAYWPLIRDPDNDLVGGYNLTPYNSPTVARHAPMLYPTQAMVGLAAAEAPPAGIVVPVLAMDGVHSVVFGGQVVR